MTPKELGPGRKLNFRNSPEVRLGSASTMPAMGAYTLHTVGR